MWRLVARQRMHPATFSVAIAQDPLQHPGLKTMNEDAEEAHASMIKNDGAIPDKNQVNLVEDKCPSRWSTLYLLVPSAYKQLMRANKTHHCISEITSYFWFSSETILHCIIS
jgi:hypothetical protein